MAVCLNMHEQLHFVNPFFGFLSNFYHTPSRKICQSVNVSQHGNQLSFMKDSDDIG